MLSIGGPMCTSLARTVAGIRRRSPQTTMKCTRYLIDHLIISLTIPKSTCPTQLIDTWGCRRWCHQGLVGGKSGRCTIYVFWWCALVVHRDKTQVISRGANDSRASNRGASPDIRHPTCQRSTLHVPCQCQSMKWSYSDTFPNRIYSLVWYGQTAMCHSFTSFRCKSKVMQGDRNVWK